MNKFKLSIIILSFTFLGSCFIIDNQLRNVMTFDDIDSVQTKIISLDTILHKLPKAEGYKLKHYKIKEDSMLIINNTPINKINDLSYEDFIIPEISDYLNEIEIKLLFKNIIYLYENDINRAIQGEAFWQFYYYYKTSIYCDSYGAHRYVMFVYDSNDIKSSYFKWSKIILGRYDKLILFKDEDYLDMDDFPGYPEIKNPYSKNK